jgi:hypothetical protein
MLKTITEYSGKTGEAAKVVAKVLHPHFVKEGKFCPMKKETYLRHFEM